MTEEELIALELREDRRLVELGLDPNASAPALWEQLSEMAEEIKRRESNEHPSHAPNKLNVAQPLTREAGLFCGYLLSGQVSRHLSAELARFMQEG